MSLYTIYDRGQRPRPRRIVLCGACIALDTSGKLHPRNKMPARHADAACLRCGRVQTVKAVTP